MPHQSVVVIQPRILVQFSLKVNLSSFEPASGQVGPVLHLESGRELGVNKVGPPASGDMGPSSIGAAGPSPTAEAAGRFGSVSLDQNLSPPPLPLDYGAAVLLSLSSAASGCATASGTASGTCRPLSRWQPPVTQSAGSAAVKTAGTPAARRRTPTQLQVEGKGEIR